MLTLFLIIYGASMLLVLLSYTPWAQKNIRLITGYGFYLVLGIFLSCSLLGLTYAIAKAIDPGLIELFDLN